MITFLTENDILRIHKMIVELFRSGRDPVEPPGPRDNNLIGSATGRPRTSLAGVEKYPTLELKAAALFHSLVMNHPFHNGNKRTALMSMMAFLDVNGRRLVAEVADDEILGLVLGVAKGTFPAAHATTEAVVEATAAWLRDRTSAVRARASNMRTRDFVDKCKKAGLRVKEDNMGWQILGKPGSRGIVKLGRDRRELTGNAMRVNLQTLGLTDTGITIDGFQEGVSAEQEILRRFQNVLRRLAHV